jgi:hypothetical protein
MRALSVVCDKSGLEFTAVDSGGTVVEESDLAVPANRTDRPSLKPDVVYVRKAGSGKFKASPERHEVEGLVQVAAHRRGIPCELRMTEQIRASHVPKASGAYEELLKQPEVAARSNAAKRERYLYAITALKDCGG